MGSVAVSKERLLVIFYQPLSPAVEGVLREKFADAEVTIYQSKPGVPAPPGMSWICISNTQAERETDRANP